MKHIELAEKLFQTKTQVLLKLIGLGILVLLPLLLSSQPYSLHILITMYLNIIVVLGFVIILGFSKQFSLGQVAFYGYGGYVVAILTKQMGVNFFLALALAGLISGLISIIIAIPGSRFKGPWLALVTISFAEISRQLFIRVKGVTNGNAGFPGIPKPSIFGKIFFDYISNYYIFLIILLIAIYFVVKLKNSPLGRILFCLGDDENISNSIGINVLAYKIIAFFIGSIYSGVAGGLYAAFSGFISPTIYTMKHTLFFLAIFVVGGRESILGVVISVVFFTFINNILRAFFPWDMVVYGFILIIAVNLIPYGIGNEIDKFITGIKQKIKFKNLGKDADVEAPQTRS